MTHHPIPLFLILLTLYTATAIQANDLPAPVEDPLLEQMVGAYRPTTQRIVAHRNEIKIDWVLNEQFLRISVHIDFYEGIGYVRPTGEGTYEMHWFDAFGRPTRFQGKKTSPKGGDELIEFVPQNPGKTFLHRIRLRRTSTTLEIEFESLRGDKTARSVYRRPLPAGPNTTCPVMDGEEVDREIFIDHGSRRIYFCCEECIDTFRASPQEYLQKLESGQ